MNKKFTYILTLILLVMSGTAMAQGKDATPNVPNGGNNVQNVTSTQRVIINGSVFGGGNKANVGGSCSVLVDQANASIGNNEDNDGVYGGGALAQVNTTDGSTLTPDKSTTVTIKQGSVRGNVYGGGLGERPEGENPGTAADVFGPVQVTINGGTVTGKVFGCNNLYGAPQGTVNVDITQIGQTMSIQNVYGGGNLAAYTAPTATDEDLTAHNYPQVNVNHGTVGGSVFGGGFGATATVTGNPQVTIGDDNNDHTATVSYNVYGGGDLAAVTGSPYIKVWNAHSTVTQEVYGGGNQANVSGSTTVDVIAGTISQNVYGGGALADVGTSNSDQTTVNILGGTVTGNVYGGGLGRKAAAAVGEEGDPGYVPPVAAIPAAVNGVVEVNIGAAPVSPSTEYTGEATIYGSVFGCNNTNGTPTDNVTVNIYKTKRTEGTNTVDDTGFALSQVFGGGNQANYEPTAANKKATVHVWTCDNTIEYVYGGGNAADLGTSNTNSATDVIIDGGRIEWVFGGGNGYSATGNHDKPYLNNLDECVTTPTDDPCPDYNPGANINGNTNVTFHAGEIHYIFGGSNQWGNISGDKTVNVLADGTCDTKYIAELYGGSNEAPTTGNVELTMGCQSGVDPDFTIGSLFGGSRKADIGTAENPANVTLTVTGGKYTNVFGGNNLGGTIYGNVTLNLMGGTMENAFGGNNAGGYINGVITVNMLNIAGSCPLVVNNIYGGGMNAAYSPNTPGAYPVVNLIHGTVSKKSDNTAGNVYGGGYGSTATVTSNPTVKVGYDASSMSTIVTTLLGSTPFSTSEVEVEGNVYGGGEAAPVVGNTTVTLKADNPGTSVSTTVSGSVFGGGNLANVSGSVAVNLTGGTVTHDVYGGGALADVNVTNNALTSGATTTVTLNGSSVRKIYGGGLGRKADDTTDPPITAVAAKVYGPVQVTVNSGTVTDVFGCNNENGAPQSTVTVDIHSNVGHNVYGGGNLAAYDGTPDVNITAGTVGGSVFGGGNEAGVSGGDVAMTGGTVLTGLYGGCNTSGTVSGDISVSITGGTLGAAAIGTPGEEGYVAEQRANVHGGGYGPSTKTGANVEVTINQQSGENPPAAPVIWGDVYGGSALGSVNSSTEPPAVNTSKHTSVTLNKGTVHGDIYGGGLGQASPAIEAKVWSPVQVTVNGGTVTGGVYGCNNIKGAPQSTVKVDINGTDPAPSANAYALGSVFGGGNQAAYTYGNGYPQVTVHNCNNSIEYVYGGGNAAAVVSTDVKIYGGNTIGYVFGGGNGTGVAANFEMVSGNAVTNIYGGTINHVFAGNNTSGAITGTSEVHVNKTTESGHSSCPMYIGEVYGGGNFAAGKAGTIDIGCTGDLVALGANEHYGVDQEGITYVYGGANQANITNNILLNINSGNVENVFGGNNTSGNITGTVTVNINKTGTCGWYVGNVYGGGNHAAYTGTPDVNIIAGTVSGKVFGGGNDITTDNAGVAGSNVEMTGGTVLGGVYGGCNLNGYVTGNSVVTIYGGNVGSNDQLSATTPIVAQVFGGGYGEATRVSGNVTVTVDQTGSNETIIYGDVYGGSDQGQVNTNSDNTTTVRILNGTLETNSTTSGSFTTYRGGNVFGGGRGVDNDPSNAEKGKVNGKVVVNIGTGIPDEDDPYKVNVTGLDGNATIGGNVYGCNNSGGSPQSDVTVNIFKTAHNEGETGYAIANVFGGGNEANFSPAEGKTYVNVYTCDNTIYRVFGGGNAAATPDVNTHIQGGRFFQVFGGGNGERGEQFGANVNGHVHLYLHGGNISEYYGGSNQHGTISGTVYTDVLNDGPCESVSIEDFYCGGNFEDIFGDLVTTIDCSNAHFTNLYGGCNQATIYGDVILNLRGGIYTNVFGGSKGVPGTSADIRAVTSEVQTAHPGLTVGHGGNVTLNLYGGTIVNVFGGSNINGNIEGKITVNVLDEEEDCPLIITNIYGGSNETNYEPTNASAISPVVNVIHAKNGISGNVYGGSRGVEGAIGDDVTKVVANPLVNIGYDAATMNNSNNESIQSYVSAHSSLIAAPRAIVSGSVFGGGDAAKIVGNTAIFLRNRAKVFGNVYGGGNMGEVTGDTKVIVNGANN